MNNEPINLIIDGVSVTAKPGQTVLQAALDAGIYIPYLCYYPKMKPYGACRSCVVETDSNGRKGIVASCTAPCSPGMVVDSSTPQVLELRKGIIELLMSEHPHGCLTCHRIELCGPQDICQRHVAVTDRCTICPKNERCELKDTVRSVDLDLRTSLSYNRRNLPIHTDDPFYDRDYNLCIVCARCVRVCDEVRVDNALTLTSRSGVALVGTSHGVSLIESGCEFCGACIDVCPTGALVERDYKWEKAVREVPTICTNCPVGCSMLAEVNKFDKVVRFKGDLAGEANVGQACFKGKFGYDYPNDKARIKKPFIVENKGADRQRVPVSFREACNLIADRMQNYKPEEVAVISSPRGSNEDQYVAQKFARLALRTNNVASAYDLNPSALKVLHSRLGHSGSTNSIWSLEKAGAILVVCGNPTEEQNVLTAPVKRAARDGATIVVIDSRETELTRYTKHWLRVKPGTEPLVVSALLKLLNTSMSNGVEQSREQMTAEVEYFSYVISTAGVSENDIRNAARVIHDSSPTAFIFGNDGLVESQSVALADMIVDLAVVTDSIGHKAGGIFPLYYGANTMGARDLGCGSDLLPGGILDDAAANERIAKLWGVSPPNMKGLNICSIIQSIVNGDIKALILMSDGISAENGLLEGFKDALSSLDFLAVSAVFDDALTEYANVVIPAKVYAEQDGTITNLEGRVQRLRPLWAPKHDEKSGWEVFSGIASVLDVEGFGYENSDHVKAEIAAAVPAYSDLLTGSTSVSIARGEADKIPSSLVLHPPENLEPPRNGSAMIFTPGRVLHQKERPAHVVSKDNMNYVGRQEFISIHKQDAVAAGIAENDEVVVKYRDRVLMRGITRLDGAHRGTVSATTLFAQLASSMQDSRHPDPSPHVEPLLIRHVTVVKEGEETKIR